MESGKIVVFSAPSGAGKSTILSSIRERVEPLTYSISATTRKPRDGEVDGVDYFFYNVATFKKMIKEDSFVEWAEVHENYYGTPKSYIDEQLSLGKIVALDIDVQGKALLDRVYPDAIGIFIEAPSLDILEERLRARGTDTDEVISLRLKNAEKEQRYARFEGKYDYYIINDKLDETISKITKIIEQIQR